MTVHILLNIFLSILIGLIALGIGLLLRRVVVRRLKKTVLDNWLIQTLGVLVIFPPLILAIVPIVIVWDVTIITSFWSQITAGLQGKDITNAIFSLVWNIVLSILIIALGLGIQGIYYVYVADCVVRAALCYWRWRQARWKLIQV